MKSLVIRLLSEQGYNNFKILDSESVITPESSEDACVVIANTAGNLLSKFIDGMKTPEVVNILLNTKITDWTIRDLENLNVVLTQSQMRITWSIEADAIETIPPEMVQYLYVQNSNKELGIIPTATTKLASKASVNLLEIYTGIGDRYLANPKFTSDPYKDALDQIENTQTLLGTPNPYAFQQISKYLNLMQIDLLTITNI